MSNGNFINYHEFSQKYLFPFGTIRHYYSKDSGYIVWRLGTGENAELLHIRTFHKGRGYGRELVYHMLDQLSYNPPYYSVFGFTRTSNEEAQRFYGALGFNLHLVDGLYAEGTAIMFWQSYERLLAEKLKHGDLQKD